MIHICKKWNCPKRFSIGSETDSDHLTFLCTECREVYYYSEKRTRTIVIFFRMFFLSLLISIIGYLLWPILTKPCVQDVFDFGIKGDSLAINELIYPKLLDSSIHNFKVEMGTGKDFESSIPNGFKFTSPGKYEIKFSTDNISGKKSIVVFDPIQIKNEMPHSKPINNLKVLEVSDRAEERKKIKPVIPSETLEIDVPPKAKCPNQGQECDDNDANTKGDIIRSNCKCEGILIEIIKIPYYQDLDGDGFGDPQKEDRYAKGKMPEGYVDNAIDQCPSRPAPNSQNGCPTLELKDFIVDVDGIISPNVKFDILPNDVIFWSGSDGVSIIGNNTLNPKLKGIKLGLNSVSLSIQNTSSAPINISKNVDLCVRLSNEKLIEKMNSIILPGQYDSNNAVPSNHTRRAENDLKYLLDAFNTSSYVVYDGKTFGPGFRDFCQSKLMTKESYVTKVKADKITYDDKLCKVEKIYLKLDK